MLTTLRQSFRAALSAIVLPLFGTGCATYTFGEVGNEYFTPDEKMAFDRCGFLHEGAPGYGDYWPCSTVVSLEVANPSMRESIYFRQIKPWKGAEAARDQIIQWHKDDGQVVDVKPASAAGLNGYIATWAADKDGWKPAEFIVVEAYSGQSSGYAASCQTHLRPDLSDQSTLDRCAKWMNAAIRVAKARH